MSLLPFGDSDYLSFDELLEEHQERKKEETAGDEEIHIKDYFKKLGDAAKCRFGKTCERRSACTFYHGDDDSLKRQFCECSSTSCDRPHPNRKRGQKRRQDTSVTCFECGGSHHIKTCRYVKCNKCLRYGHMSSDCLS